MTCTIFVCISELTWTNFAENGAGTIDFRRLKKLKKKRSLEEFTPLVDALTHETRENEEVLKLFNTSTPTLLDERNPVMIAIRERVGRMGVDIDKFLDVVYDRSSLDSEGGYAKRVAVDFSIFDERHRGRLWALYQRAPSSFGYKGAVAELQRRLSDVGVSVEHFMQLAYYTKSQPFSGRVDVGTEHG